MSAVQRTNVENYTLNVLWRNGLIQIKSTSLLGILYLRMGLELYWFLSSVTLIEIVEKYLIYNYNFWIGCLIALLELKNRWSFLNKLNKLSIGLL